MPIFTLMNHPNIIQLVLVYKHDPEDTEIFSERVDAERVGEYYRLIHVPAFAPNIAYGDIIKVEYDDGEYYFDELVEESGFSVVHVIIWDAQVKDSVIDVLTELYCGVNTNVADNYLVISVPPAAPYKPIREYLSEQKAKGTIDFGETCLSSIHKVQVE